MNSTGSPPVASCATASAPALSDTPTTTYLKRLLTALGQGSLREEHLFFKIGLHTLNSVAAADVRTVRIDPEVVSYFSTLLRHGGPRAINLLNGRGASGQGRERNIVSFDTHNRKFSRSGARTRSRTCEACQRGTSADADERERHTLNACAAPSEATLRRAIPRDVHLTGSFDHILVETGTKVLLAREQASGRDGEVPIVLKEDGCMIKAGVVRGQAAGPHRVPARQLGHRQRSGGGHAQAKD